MTDYSFFLLEKGKSCSSADLLSKSKQVNRELGTQIIPFNITAVLVNLLANESFDSCVVRTSGAISGYGTSQRRTCGGSLEQKSKRSNEKKDCLNAVHVAVALRFLRCQLLFYYFVGSSGVKWPTCWLMPASNLPAWF